MEYDFLATIQRIMRLTAARSKVSTTKRLDSLLRMQALLLIDQQTGIGVTNVANALSIKKPTASQLVERLVMAGDMVRTADTKDRRSTQLHLTDAGRRELKRLQSSFAARTNRIFASLDVNERQQLAMLLQKIADGLEQIDTLPHDQLTTPALIQE